MHVPRELKTSCTTYGLVLKSIAVANGLWIRYKTKHIKNGILIIAKILVLVKENCYLTTLMLLAHSLQLFKTISEVQNFAASEVKSQTSISKDQF